MAVKLQANYSKKIGLPQYSSHSFMASVEVELTDLSQVENECQRLYSMLQQAVDSELQQVGYLPADSNAPSNTTVSRHSHENRENKVTNPHNQNPVQWSCTDGQRTFITKLIDEHELDEAQIEALSRQMFNKAIPHLNKMQASQFIEELLSTVGQPRQQQWSSSDKRSTNGHHARRPANSNSNRRMEDVA